MYETQTFETIMDRCLSRVSSSVDKREGSVIYDALAPACAELATLYTELSNILDRAFPDTATGEDLDRKCMERGVIRRQRRGIQRPYWNSVFWRRDQLYHHRRTEYPRSL